MKKNIIKRCKVHGRTKHFKRPDTKSTYRCRRCAGDSVSRRRKKLKQMSVDYKGGQCKRCGYNKCMSALIFHHLDSSKKDFGIAQAGHCRSWERLKRELDKCDLLCRNCHAEIHNNNDSVK